MNELKKNLLHLSDKFIYQKKYWLEKMIGDFSKTSLLSNSGLESYDSLQMDEKKIIIPDELTVRLNKISKGSDLSLYIIFLTALKILIYKYTSDRNIIVGSPIYVKNMTDETLNNYVPLRDEINDNLTFKELICQLRQTVLEAYKNQDYPLYEIEELKISNEDDYSKFFDVICLFKGIHNDYDSNGRFNVFSFERLESNLKLNIKYNANLFMQRSIEQVYQDYINLLTDAVNSIDNKVCDLKLLSKEEEEKLLIEFNKNAKEFDKSKTISQIFEMQVEKYPNNIAAVFEEEAITYMELNKKANQLARILRKNGVGAETIVAIMVEKSLDMVIGILAVLKAGGAYLPIDAEYPSDLIRYIISDSGTSILLTQNKIKDKIEFIGKQIIMDGGSVYIGDDSNLDVINDLDNAAYIIYTSGTTGKPKGVLIEQINILTYINAFYNQFHIDERDTILVQASYSFDHFVEEMYPVILKGGKLVIVKKSDIVDLDILEEIINKNKINIVTVSPHLINELNKLPKEKLSSVKLFLSGGDTLKEKYISNIKNYAEIYNTYGPTEATVCATYYNCKKIKNSKVLIGKPIANYNIYILDHNKNLMPIGLPGEIYISGSAIAREYIHNYDLTDEKFLVNPFDSQERMYRTGDVGRWLSDGNIEFLGRNDNQVKIRGYRIEVGQIESKILEFDGVKEVFVMDREDKYGVKYLCAYIVSEKDINESELRVKLSKELPWYMIPSYFVQLNRMPMTLNGFKIDKNSLPEPSETRALNCEYIGPRNEIEEKLVNIWSEILEISKDTIGVNSNFFELGGHSINAMRTMSNINIKFNLNLPLSIIFEAITVEKIGRIISENIGDNYSYIMKQSFKEHYPLSPAQQRMYLLNQFNPEGISYNIPSTMIIEGILDKTYFENALKVVLNRHEAFRTSFEIVNNVPMQKIWRDIEFKIDYSLAKEEEVEHIANQFVKPFDLSKAPLVKIHLVKIKDDRHVLFIDMHHIISDGMSVDILMEDLSQIYKGEKLKDLRIQYKDFAVWQNELLKKGMLKNQEQYWLNNLNGKLPILDLPTDYPRPEIKKYNGKKLFFELPHYIVDKLKNITVENEVTMYMTLLAAYNVLLTKYTLKTDIIVGMPIHGRNSYDLNNVVGMFVNVLPIRSYPTADKTFKEFLKEIKIDTLNAFKNQDYPFEMIVEKLVVNRDLSRNPIVDTLFISQNSSNRAFEINDLKILPCNLENKTSKMDLIWDVLEVKDAIKFSLEYCTDLFKRETVEQFIIHYLRIIDIISNNVEINIKDIEIFNRNETEAISRKIDLLRKKVDIDFEY